MTSTLTFQHTAQPKAPRWITTESGLRAWNEIEAWRRVAANALSVQDRRQLLAEAEQLLAQQQ
ncbi:MAG TPA: hypothetical protein VFT66_22250 [Roseiflexaceae bacterium]|jgi:hypothetical protein|nr:hypothetical protein [Roseiflexaceae bacterium]